MVGSPVPRASYGSVHRREGRRLGPLAAHLLVSEGSKARCAEERPRSVRFAPMRVAFVTPRYGLSVYGGAEWGARQLAERLAAELGWSTEVFTTCALDHTTWADVMPPGVSLINGVIVHRYASASGRAGDFDEAYAQLALQPAVAPLAAARRWVDLQGPVAPGLIEAIREGNADVTVFYPYLYHPTVHGIGVAPSPTVLHPAAHDEPAFHLPVFKATFRSADALAYHTEAERMLVEQYHPVADRPQIVLGLGVDPPLPRGRPGTEVAGLDGRPYLVSVGRVDAQKGSVMLAELFRAFKRANPGPLALVLVGPINAEMGYDPDIVVTGAVTEQDKWDIVRDALVSISPSPNESFSLVVMEAAAVGLPVMVNALCGPTREFCERSGGGLLFSDQLDFQVALRCLLADSQLRQRLGAAGRRFVETHYRWPTVIARYAAFLTVVAQRRKIVSPYLEASS